MDNLIKQISRTESVGGGYGERLTESQSVEFIKFSRKLPCDINFVDDKDDVLLGLFEHGGDGLIGRREACRHVDHEQHKVGRLDGSLGLGAHVGHNLALRCRLNAAGVGQRKGFAVPLAVGVEPISGHARGVLDNGEPSSHQFIK
ncbi:hypothetical protein SDC9_71565 [bioreactor metagenome]|uniref:Uncharacterized protein n=1 Tax=bioreactor metagenome TaxID=1076179 RepID=A0A644Y943_9ZZZZ